MNTTEWNNPDTLELLHKVESALMYRLDSKDQEYLIEYLNDDPMCVDTQYLIEVMGF